MAGEATNLAAARQPSGRENTVYWRLDNSDVRRRVTEAPSVLVARSVRLRRVGVALGKDVTPGVPLGCVANSRSVRWLLTRYDLDDATQGAYSPVTSEQHPHPHAYLVRCLCLVRHLSVR